jgi:hypothetical protein
MRLRLSKLEVRQSLAVPSVRFIGDDNSTIRAGNQALSVSTRPLHASPDRISASFDPVSTLREFETVLKASRVYRRAEPNETDMSFRSSVARSHAWSALSGLSLAEISVISVIALPLSSKEVKAMYQFLLPDNEAPRRGALNRALSALTLARTRRLVEITPPQETIPRPISPPDPRPWKLAILGHGGVGKTALLARVS